MMIEDTENKNFAADRNLTPREGQVSRQDRKSLLKQSGCVLWLTGLSGSGKLKGASVRSMARH